MAINFTKAIELQVVRKLKSHAKVGYQDHPNGDKQCSGCSMFVEGSQPSCTHVAPPIAAHGYCDDFERIDPNARARVAIGKAKSFAEVLKDGLPAQKAFSPDEPRDAVGRWTSGDGGPDHPDWMHGSEGNSLASAMSDVPSGMQDSISKIEDVHAALDQASTEAESHAEDEPDPQEDPKAFAAWEKQHNSNLASVADQAMELRNVVADHLQATAGVLSQLDERIQRHADENGKRMSKSMTVGDVHAATALGNQPAKQKARDFLTTIGEVKGGARVVALPTLPAPVMDFGKALEKIKADARGGIAIPIKFGEPRIISDVHWIWHEDFDKRTVPVMFMRHGPTRFNNQTDMSKDRVRSWNNVPLTQDGIDDAQKAGEKLKDEGIGYIVSSDLGRAIQTSKIVAKAVGIKPIHDYGMRPWNLGKFTGMSTDDAHDGIMHHVENPDETVPEGESFNTFKGRAAQTMLSHIKKAGKKKMLVVSHHRNERLFASMRPDGTVDAKKFMKSGEDPGDFTEMEFDTGELENAIRNAKEGHGEAEVSKVWGSNAELPDGVRSVLPGEAQTIWRKVANDRIKAGQPDKSAIRQAWTAVKNGWSKTKDGAWVRKTWLGPDGVHEFLEAELAKLGGESSIEKPTDNVNVSLQLTPLEEDMARSPFPYDQYFFVNLRNDQKERVLAALTDQDPLPERTISLSALSAVQDRVDPAKIQSMMEGAAEKLAVVVRTGPGRYCIIDGHHRLSAALLSGVKTVQVKYLDIEAFDPRVHTDNNPGSSGEPVAKLLGMGIEFDVRKTDEDQQLVFGWASICSIDGEDVVDKQDEIIPEDELEKAAYDFVLYCRQQGDMHERMGVGRTVESMVFTKEKQDAIGVDLGFAGWWVGFKVDDPGVWKRIKAGDLPEFSIGGKARRETVDA